MHKKNNITCRLFILLGLMTFLPSVAYADCTSPAGPAGRIDYFNTGENVFKYCNGTDWVPWAGEPVTGAPAPSAGFNLTDLGDVDTSGVGDGECITYNNGAGEWQAGSCGGGGGTPAGADRRIQFNNSGAFGADANFVYTAAGDFIVGSYQLDDTGTGSEDNRVFFDVSKGAFRAGGAIGTEWDDANVGVGSIGLGTGETGFPSTDGPKASGVNSIAMGSKTVASGSGAIAFGNGSSATGDVSVAIGSSAATANNAVALGVSVASAAGAVAVGTDNVASGAYSLALGATSEAAGTNSLALGLGSIGFGANPKVSGDNSFGIFMGNQENTDITQSNAMVLLGGKFGIGDTTPDAELDVVGDINYTGVMVDVSDIRMKYDIKPLDSPLQKLASLNGFAFKMKGDEKKTVEYGVSAQDVQKVFPELVHQVDDDGHLGVAYDGLIAPMIESIKELKAENEALRARLDTLEQQQAGGR